MELNTNDESMECRNNEDSILEDNGSTEAQQDRPKRGRKRKVLGQSRADRKRLYNTNKPHINSKGKRVEAVIFDETFVCNCPKKCTRRVSLELRKRLFSQFHNMGTFEGRCALLVGCVTDIAKNIPRTYSMFGHDVCKFALLRTLQINESRVTTALKKHKHCDTYADGRGKYSGGSNAFPLSKTTEVREHIKSFPKYISHYTRNQTDSKFLNSELNLSDMYKLYKCKYEFENPASKAFYKNIFYRDFNLRFKVPKKDTCLKCDVYIAKIKTSSGSERIMLEEWHKEHLDQADSLRKQMNDDLAIAKVNSEIQTLTFDMQKTLPVPKLPTSIAYYKRQLNLYNLGIHVGKAGQDINNIWLEYEGSKGTQEIGSCLKKYIEFSVVREKKLILWSDSCGGQNRSIKFVLMMIHVLQNHQSLESISMRYLLSGHSFLPNDSAFGDIECKLKTHERLYTDIDYAQVMGTSRHDNRFYIERIYPDEFLSVQKLEKQITNRKIDLHKTKINWLETHEILIEKNQPFIIKFKKKIDGDFQSVNIERRGPPINLKEIELDELWPMGRPLSNEKVSDLKEQLQLVPDDKKWFYSFLSQVPTREFTDDVDGFGEFVDFEPEE